MKKFYGVSLLLITLPILLCCFSACPILELGEGIKISGTIQIDSAVTNAGYIVDGVKVYSRDGQFLGEASVNGKNSATVSKLSWEMELIAADGTPVTFWVALRQGFSSVTYFAAGQDDIVSTGDTYSWTVDTVNIPIFNEDDLRKIGVVSGYEPDGRFVMVSDIALKNPWVPLCAGHTPFSGSFDGNSRTISGFRFETGNPKYLGLFGNVHGAGSRNRAVIKNLVLNVDEAEITLGGATPQYVGFIAGFAYNTEFNNVIVKGTGVKFIKDYGGSLNLGGLAGWIEYATSVTNSNSSVMLNLENTVAGAVLSVGGLVGTVSGVLGVAGMVGRGHFLQSYHDGQISVSCGGAGVSTTIASVGGLLGRYINQTNDIRFEECYASGNISVSGAGATSRLGAFVGNPDAANLSRKTPELIRCAILVSSIDYFPAASFSSYRIGPIYGYDSELSPVLTPPVYCRSNLRPSDTNTLRSWVTDGTPTGFQNAESLPIDQFTSDLFSEQNPSLAWDFNKVWYWNRTQGRPMFQAE